MKKLLFLTSFIFLMLATQAQKIGDYYRFSVGNSTYSSITGGTQVSQLLGSSDYDDGEVGIPLDFNFKYGGQIYNDLTIGVNGAISFVSANVDPVNDLSSGDFNKKDIIAPLWDDLCLRTADNSSISYKTGTGTFGQYIRIEWKNISWRASGQTVTFSILLHEDGRIILWYGPNNSTEARTASIGFNAEGGNNFVSVTPGSPATIDTTNANNSISSDNYPAQNTYYLFTYGPENNDCDNALALNVLQADAQPTEATLLGASDTDGDSHSDVWFTATVPDDGNLNVKTSQVPGSDMTYTFIDLYSGTCGSLTEITSGSGHTPVLHLTGRTPGETIYIKVQNPESSEPDGKFNILAYMNPPANDACDNYEPVTSFPYSISQDAVGATNNNGFLLYNGVGMNDGVWYGLQGDGAKYTITVTPDGTWNPEIAVFTGSCGNLTMLQYADNSGTGSETITFTTTVTGDIYYINIGQASHIINNPEGLFDLSIQKTCGPTLIPVSLPADTAACEGDDVELHVEATGTGLTDNSYSWFQGNGSLGVHGQTLTINNIQLSGSNNYTCTITNVCGEVFSSATSLTVYPVPSYNSQPQDQVICTGDDVTLTVDANNADYYLWYKDNSEIAGGTDNFYTVTDALQDNDEGWYKVNIGNTHCGQIAGDAFFLSVSKLVSILGQPQDINTVIDNDVTFSVSAEGNNLTYQWKKDENDITGETNSDLTITNVQQSDAGTYSVVVSGTCGTVTSDDAVLSVSTTGINDNIADYIHIYPNLVADFMNVSANDNIKNICIFDMTGKKIYAANQNSNMIKINLSKLSKGFYIIKIKTENRIIEKKFVKQ